MAPRRDRTHQLVSAVLVATILAASGAPAYANTLSYFARDAAQEAVLSEMTTHPAALGRSGTTYLAYQGPGFDPYIATLDEQTGTWGGPYKIGTNALRLDAHGAPALYFDAAGYAHAFFGGHSTTIQHKRSSAPESVAAWTDRPSPGSGTYPQVLDQSGSKVLLFYRRTGSDWVYRSSPDDAATFGPEIAVLDADSEALWYASAYSGAGDRIHLAFSWLDMDLINAGALFVRRNLYYAAREPTGAWRAADGTTLSMPISLSEAEAHCRIVDAGSNFVNELTARETESGDPVLLYLLGRGSGPGAYSWMFKRREGGTWTSSVPITTTDHYFDAATFQPTGSSAYEAFLVTKDSDARGSLDWDYRGRGGRIERWTSADGGSTWQFAERVSPAEPGMIYSSPVIVRTASADARVLFTDWTDDESDFLHRMFVWGDGGLVARETTPTVERVAGANRGATSIAVSRRAFPEGARYVVLATERDYPDALAGTPLASTVNGPVLLTPPGYLPDNLAAEIKRLGAKNAIVLGGTSVVSGAVAAQLKSKAGCTSVERVAGANRYDTCLAISRRMRDRTRTITTAVVVSGRNWPDAVAAAPLAGANDWPIVLADGGYLPTQSKTVLAEYGITSTLIIGQTDVVGAGVARVVPSPTRIGGDDRYATAALLAEYSLSHGLLPGRIMTATGAAFPDALSAGMLGARAHAPLLLVRNTDMTAPTREYVTAHSAAVSDLWLIGESDVIAESVRASLGTLVHAY
ncbi:MAG: cell wall-binding repeat-containing protein [Coriobacteriia bacterium]